MGPGSQWTREHILARPLPSCTQRRLGTAVGAPEPPHCLEVRHPQALIGGGGGHRANTLWVGDDFMGFLSASMGFIGRWAPVAPGVTLLRKSGPGPGHGASGMGAEAGGVCLPGRVGHEWEGG